MEYFIVDFPSGEKLGLSVISRGEDEPHLGDTLIENIPDLNSYGQKNGVRAGDFIIAINDRYVAYIGHEKCIQCLQTVLRQKKGAKMLFCRPNPSDWSKYLGDEKTIIHEGIMQKQSGLLRRKTSRYVKLTKEVIEFLKEKDESKTFQVSTLALSSTIPSFSPQALSSPAKTSFPLIIGTTEIELDCGEATSCVLWQHAIHTAIRNVFNIPLPKFYEYGSHQQVQSSSSAAARSNVIPVAHLTAPIAGNPPPTYGVETNPNSVTKLSDVKQSSKRSLGNPSWMLLLSRVVVNPSLRPMEESESNTAQNQIEDPRLRFSDERLKALSYDFALEKAILQSEAEPKTLLHK